MVDSVAAAWHSVLQLRGNLKNKDREGKEVHTLAMLGILVGSHSIKAKSNLENKKTKVSIHRVLSYQARMYSLSSYQRRLSAFENPW
jgi:ABC-type antimicrobial peptide transport system ATPase subunit